jgi:CRISPR-associated protein Cas2
MLVLITYDVNTTEKQGRKRLSQIAKLCVKYGQRVQNSVFECLLEPFQYKELQNKLMHIMNTDKDSIRFYNLGTKYDTKIEHYGTKASYEPEGPLIL